MPFSRNTASYGLPRSDEEEEAYRRELRDAEERSRQTHEEEVLFASYLVPSSTSVAELQEGLREMRATAQRLAEEQCRYEAPPNPDMAHQARVQNAAAAQGAHADRPPATSFRPTEYPEDWERARQREQAAAQLRADRAIAEQEQHDLDQEGARKRHVRGGITHNSYRNPSLTGTVRSLFEGPGMRPNAGADAAVQGLDDEDHDDRSMAENHDHMMTGYQARVTASARGAIARVDNDATEDDPKIHLARFQQIREDEIMAHQMLNEEYATMPDDETLARAVQEEEYEAAETIPPYPSLTASLTASIRPQLKARRLLSLPLGLIMRAMPSRQHLVEKGVTCQRQGAPLI